MSIKQIKELFFNELTAVFDKIEAESIFYILLEEIHNMKRIDLALAPDFELNTEQTSRWEFYIKELQLHKPIQYILGKTEFFGLPFLVNEHTLIPRPETEELVEWILKSESQKSKVKSQKSKESNFQLPTSRILDIGTGTGCIAISLAKNLENSEVFALDVSENALEIAKKNAQENDVKVQFIQQNILEVTNPISNFQLPTSIDIIVSNPPYVRHLEKEEIKPNVLEYEPHLALFVPNDDALLFYRKIAEIAKEILAPNGQLFFEINQYLGKETVVLLQNLGFKNIELKKDLYGNDRMIRCENP